MFSTSQQISVDCDETFSSVVKPATIRIVLSLATSRHWHVHQLDFKNAFLHGQLSEIVYMHQLLGFRDPQHPDHVCLLQKFLYGLKQAPRVWFQWFSSYATIVGFTHSCCDSSLFLLHQEFSMTDLGSLNYILGISISRDDTCMFLHERQYALEVLKRVGMLNCYPCRTPIDIKHKLGVDGVNVSDPTLHRSPAGDLQYLTFTRPDLSFAAYGN
ncbi:ribonuclease H-like domain-containing protein [Tanacetum coccineum]